MERTIALVTAQEARALDEDLPLLVEALRAPGIGVETPCWDDPDYDWAACDAVVIRSTWDYIDRIDRFLDWVDRTGSCTRLFNPPAVVRWNTDKHYLRDLSGAGVGVVPTRFAEPGENPAAVLTDFLGGGAGALSVGDGFRFDEFVIKPAVGVGSRDAARYRRGEASRAEDHLHLLLAAGRSALLQPYLGRVDEVGETALILVDTAEIRLQQRAASGCQQAMEVICGARCFLAAVAGGIARADADRGLDDELVELATVADG
jgi:hypothetical protein